MADDDKPESKNSWLKRLRKAHDLTNGEFRVLVLLLTYTNKDRAGAHPGRYRLAADAKMHTRTVERALESLAEKGYIRVTEVGGNQYGQGLANVYAITTPRTQGRCGDRPSESTRSVSGPTKGRCEDRGKVGVETDPSGKSFIRSSSSPSIIPNPSDSGSTQASTGRDPWDPTDAELFDALVDELDLDGIEESAALGMYESGYHPTAIRNAVVKARRTQ